MNHNLRRQSFGKTLRQIFCAALAVAITGLTTQVIAKSAGEHEYQIASTRLPADGAAPSIERRITIARLP
jgi:hypothetical protein